jgi:hypothetical protein
LEVSEPLGSVQLLELKEPEPASTVKSTVPDTAAGVDVSSFTVAVHETGTLTGTELEAQLTDVTVWCLSVKCVSAEFVPSFAVTVYVPVIPSNL